MAQARTRAQATTNRTPATDTVINPTNRVGDPQTDTHLTPKSSPPIRATDLLAWFSAGTITPKLEAGQYQAQLLSAEPIVNDPDTAKHYIKFTWQLADRVITDNRFAPKVKDGQEIGGIPVMFSQLSRQFKLVHPVTVPEMIQRLLNNPVDVWVSYNQSTDGREFRNLNFVPVLAAQPAVEDPEVAF